MRRDFDERQAAEKRAEARAKRETIDKAMAEQDEQGPPTDPTK